MSFKYRKKPIEVEAVKIVRPVSGTEELTEAHPQWLMDNILTGRVRPYSDGTFHVNTIEGLMLGQAGDYLVKGIEGELYPVKASIFEASYEKVEDKPAAATAVKK